MGYPVRKIFFNFIEKINLSYNNTTFSKTDITNRMKTITIFCNK